MITLLCTAFQFNRFGGGIKGRNEQKGWSTPDSLAHYLMVTDRFVALSTPSSTLDVASPKSHFDLTPLDIPVSPVSTAREPFLDENRQCDSPADTLVDVSIEEAWVPPPSFDLISEPLLLMAFPLLRPAHYGHVALLGRDLWGRPRWTKTNSLRCFLRSLREKVYPSTKKTSPRRFVEVL